MKLPELGVKRPVFTGVIFVVILILGGISFFSLPIDLFPEIEQPTVTVITPYLGVGAEDIETLVTKEVENGLNGVANLEEISSVSKDNMSLVMLKFAWGTDLNEAMDDVRLKLEFATRNLPTDIEPPQIFKFNTAMFPVVMFGITADKSWPNLKTLAEKRIVDPLKTVPGVGTIQLISGLKRQIRIEFALDRLRAFPNISMTQVGQAIAGENLTVPAGDITIGQKAMTVRMPGEFKDPSEIEEIVVGVSPEGRVVKVKDIARVVDDFEEQTEKVFMNGGPAIMFIVFKQTGGNTVEVAGAVLKRIEEIKKTLPEDVKVITLFDTSEFIKNSIANLKHDIYFGGLLVILIVWLFLRNIRSSLIIAATIPYSLILAFIFMRFFKYTINMMSLASLAIAIGIVVDDAIVVLENVTRHMEEGSKLNRACVDGASEVGLAVSASTYTNVVIFVPLLFVTGFAGLLFRQLGFVVTITLLGSLFAALTLTPMMASKLLRIYSPQEMEVITEKRRLGIYRSFETLYLRLLNVALHNRWTTVLIAIGLSLFLMLGPLRYTRFEFMPDEDTGMIEVVAELAPGTDVNVTARLGLEMTDLMQRELVGAGGKPEWRTIYIRTGQNPMGFGSAMGEKEGNNVLQCGALLISRKLRTRSSFEYADIIRPYLQKYPGILRLSLNAGNKMQSFISGAGKPVSIEIKGADFEQTNNYANKIADRIRTLKGLVDISVSRDAGKLNLSLIVDRERLAMMGLNTGLTAMQLRAAVFGAAVSKFRDADNEYDIFLRLREQDRKSIENLENIPVLNLMGKQVTVGNIAHIEESVTPIEIDRLNQERVVKVEANAAKGANLQGIAQEIRKIIQENPPPDVKTMSITLGGNIKNMIQTYRDLTLIALLSLLLVYIVMAAQFENLVDPLIIMFSVPFALNGVLLFIVLTRVTFSMYTFLGIIMLIGIVVKNAIVYVDYVNIMRRRGKSLDEAVRISGKNRLRPVLMTTICTIMGMAPMALSRAEGSEAWRPLGIAVIGGLTLSTLVSLVLVPSIYHIVYTWLAKIGRGERKEIVIE